MTTAEDTLNDEALAVLAPLMREDLEMLLRAVRVTLHNRPGLADHCATHGMNYPAFLQDLLWVSVSPATIGRLQRYLTRPQLERAMRHVCARFSIVDWSRP